MIIGIIVGEESSSIEILLNQGKAQPALSLINDAILSGNESDAMHFNLAHAMVQLGKKDEGERLLVTIIGKDDPRSDVFVDASLMLAKLYVEDKDHDRAEQQYLQVLEESPTNVAALIGLGKSLLISGANYAGARTFIEQAVALSPRDDSILIDYGISLLHTNDPLAAKNVFNKARELNATISRNFISNLYLRFGLIDWAVQEIETDAQLAVETGQLPDFEALILLAEQYELQSRPDDAIIIYKFVIGKDARHAQAHANLGLLLLGVGAKNYAASHACGLNQEEAIPYLQTALTRDPDSPSAKIIKDALSFCAHTMSEAKEWDDRLARVEAATSGGVEEESSDGIISSDTQMIALIARQFVIQIKNTIRTLLKSFNACRDESVFKLLPFVSSICKALGLSSEQRRNETQAIENLYSARIERLARKEDMLHRWHQKQSELATIDSVEITSTEELVSYMRSSTPVIINNFQNEWSTAEEFSNAKLYNKFRDDIVVVSVAENGRFDGSESGKLWGLSEDVEVLERPATMSMSFGSFMQLVHSKTIEAMTSETYFIRYLSLDQYLGRKMTDMIQLPDYVTTRLQPLVTYLWMGSSPTTFALHSDSFENIVCQIRGFQEIILFPPSDVSFLYYTDRLLGTEKSRYY